MASGGAVDSRVVCSICLEPYKGRQPKLLPCFHTFCLPCLTTLQRRAASQQHLEGTYNVKDCANVAIVCPTCRRTIPVPPNGAGDFQSNFYVDVDDDNTAPATQPQQGGTEDGTEELLDQVRNQVKVVKSMLALLAEEEAQVESERWKVDFDINTQYAAALGLLADARDESFRSIRDVSQVTLDKLHEEMTTYQSADRRLSWFLTQQAAPSLKTFSKSELQAALIDNSMFEKLKHLVEGGKPAQFFCYTPMDKQSTSVVNMLKNYMGKATLAEENSKDSTADAKFDILDVSDTSVIASQSSSEHPKLLNDLMLKLDGLVNKIKVMESKHEEQLAVLKTENTTLQQKIQAVQDELESKYGRIHGEVMYVRDKNAILCQDVAALQAENVKLREMVLAAQESRQDTAVRKDIDCLQQELSAVKSASTQVSTQVAALQRDNSTIHTRLESSQDEIRVVRQETKSLQDSSVRMTHQFAKMNVMVAFQARLTQEVHTNKKQILINNHVMLNIGGGYNCQTGIFTAPVTGVYMFMAKLAPVQDEYVSKADIVLENVPVAYLDNNCRNITCSCQAAVKVSAGQRVWMRTFKERISFCDNWATSFCGVLIQPEL